MARQGWLGNDPHAGLTASNNRQTSFACAPAPPSGKPVVNADQTVIIIWDATNKTQHFIRKASFKSEADDFGFLIPSPSQPELAESDNSEFVNLAEANRTRNREGQEAHRAAGLQLCCAAACGD